MNATKIIELLDEKISYNEKMELLDDILSEWLHIDQDAIDLVQGINGRSEDTFNDIIYYYTANRDLEQLLDEMEDLKDYLVDAYDLEEEEEDYI